VQQLAMVDLKEYADIRRLEVKIAQSALTFDFFKQDDRLESLNAQLEAKRATFFQKQQVYRQAFEWRFAFPEVLDEQGSYVGFDVVLGNPPFGRQEEISEYRALFSKAFPNTYASTVDWYVLFIEQGLNLLRPGGQLAYVIPNSWLRASHGGNLRRWLKNKVTIQQIIDFGDLPVLAETNTNVCLLALRKAPATSAFQAALVDTLRFSKGELSAYWQDRAFTVPTESLQDSGWMLADSTVQSLLIKLKGTGKPLGEYVNNPIFNGIKTGLDKAFVIDAKTRDRLIAEDPRSVEVIKPFLLGRDVKRYQPSEATRYLILFERGITTQQRGEQEPEEWLASTYPAIYARLKPFEEKAKARTDKGMFWWELQTGDFKDQFGKPHILAPSSAEESSFQLDESGSYSNEKAVCVGSGDKYLLAVLNSKVVGYFMRLTVTANPQGVISYKPNSIAQIPIPLATPEQQTPISALVDQLLVAKAADATADTSALETEIDKAVYVLYGLNAKEIAILEA
jgi:adenine-specific DNA-methyltransferase